MSRGEHAGELEELLFARHDATYSAGVCDCVLPDTWLIEHTHVCCSDQLSQRNTQCQVWLLMYVSFQTGVHQSKGQVIGVISHQCVRLISLQRLFFEDSSVHPRMLPEP